MDPSLRIKARLYRSPEFPRAFTSPPNPPNEGPILVKEAYSGLSLISNDDSSFPVLIQPRDEYDGRIEWLLQLDLPLKLESLLEGKDAEARTLWLVLATRRQRDDPGGDEDESSSTVHGHGAPVDGIPLDHRGSWWGIPFCSHTAERFFEIGSCKGVSLNSDGFRIMLPLQCSDAPLSTPVSHNVRRLPARRPAPCSPERA